MAGGGGSDFAILGLSDFIQAADAICEAFNYVVIIVHHCCIDGARPRGHSSPTGAADGQIAVKRDKDGIITTNVEWLKMARKAAKTSADLNGSNSASKALGPRRQWE